MPYRLLSQVDREAHGSEVVSSVDIGFIGQRIQALVVPVRSLGMCQGVPSSVTLLRLSR